MMVYTLYKCMINVVDSLRCVTSCQMYGKWQIQTMTISESAVGLICRDGIGYWSEIPKYAENRQKKAT